jgi:hypothetical protein
MKLETSQDLLNRVRARHDTSWYGLAALLSTHKNTVYNWKGGHTVVDRKFAPRIAELLDESAEYVLACLEADREQDAEVLKVWRRIAERFRSPASILLVCLGLMTVHGKASAADVSVELVGNVKPPLYTLCAIGRRARRRLAKLLSCLKALVAAPLIPLCARNRSTASVPRSWPPSVTCTSAPRGAGSAPGNARAGSSAWCVSVIAASWMTYTAPGLAGAWSAAS